MLTCDAHPFQTHIGASVGSEDRLCLHAEVSGSFDTQAGALGIHRRVLLVCAQTVYPGASFEFTPIGKLQLSASCLSDTLRAPVATLHTNSGSDKIEFGYATSLSTVAPAGRVLLLTGVPARAVS